MYVWTWMGVRRYIHMYVHVTSKSIKLCLWTHMPGHISTYVIIDLYVILFYFILEILWSNHCVD